MRSRFFLLLMFLILLPLAGCKIEFGVDPSAAVRPVGTHPASLISATHSEPHGDLELYLLMPYKFPDDFDGKEMPMPEDYFYYPEYVDFEFIITEYRRARPNVRVKITEFKSPDDYLAVLKRDLASGGGPDVVFYTPSYFKDNFFDYIAEGWFEDLNVSIKEDKSTYPLDMSDLVAAAADAFIVDDCRYAMPCTISLDLYVTSVETLQNTGLSLPEGELSGAMLPDMLKSFADFINDPGCRVSYMSMFHDFLQSSKTEFWNAAKQSASFDNPLFPELLKKYLEIIAGYPIDDTYHPISPEDWTEDRMLFDRARTITGLTGGYALLDILCERTPVAFTSGTASISSIVSMNKNAKNKDAAFDFIKFAVVSAHTSSYGTMPVSKHIISECIEMLRENIKTGKALYFATNKNTFAAKRIHEDFFDSLSGLPESITAVYMPDKSINDLLEQMLEDIRSGTTPEEAVSRLQNNATAYFDSQ